MGYNKRNPVAGLFVIALLALALGGCAGTVKHMQEVPAEQVKSKPDPDKAMVVFMRPSTLGFAVQSSVFNIDQPTPQLAGIVPAKYKVAYEVEPGEHMFMVIGESADFMSAELAAGKVYYALVTPRMGFWKARFSLKPIHQNELGSEEFAQWKADTKWVVTNEDTDAWAREHMSSIQEKHNEYLPQWRAKPKTEQPHLSPIDGE